ncbi:hypothetical protein EMIHUDRAFT_433476 [Emiliania huxleyi CCMP1516]|uniref:Uncharacterized protein n=2 Tax=Emiliania huxleyi TaxID=2903 RepID=A0A0D3KVA0_EMIH1|nr:hypothetical protein EMIHUDRAFT_433476 [Emiliania huxleyi CCMP1516]EOD39685.1 hypothetical protein EMIHUDRAFT_433476 [Emiliania huxleyi CCMP1516]|eukprot:XP_005792114.1 hypothetical protein EMIHUDRAFT_433476 [Emiliania huxleyi CCMP1516]
MALLVLLWPCTAIIGCSSPGCALLASAVGTLRSAAGTPCSAAGTPRSVITLSAEPPSLRPFLDRLLACSSEEDRKASMVTEVNQWWTSGPDVAQANADELTRLMSARGTRIQTSAIAAYERGEDTSEASSVLQTLVDMTFHVKIIVRDLKKAAAAGDI